MEKDSSYIPTSKVIMSCSYGQTSFRIANAFNLIFTSQLFQTLSLNYNTITLVSLSHHIHHTYLIVVVLIIFGLNEPQIIYYLITHIWRKGWYF